MRSGRGKKLIIGRWKSQDKRQSANKEKKFYWRRLSVLRETLV